EVTIGTKPDFEVGKFEAVKIMTGAPLPEGADSVVMFEYTEDMGGEIGVVKAVTPGKNVSLKGEDVKKGDVVLRKGRVIKPYDIALLATIGRTEVKVNKKPLVSIISTGDELKEPGENLLPGEVYNINTYVLSSLVEENGGIPESTKIVKDDYAGIKKAVEAASNSDIIVLSGATSVGKKDVIPKVVGEMGKVLVHGVAMRPGEPTGFGVINNKPVFMLPGYPVASVFGFETFVIPAMQKMIGLPSHNIHSQVSGILSRKVASELGRRDFVRVRVSKKADSVSVVPIRTSGSGIVSSITKADGFIVVPENTEGIEKGKKVTVNLYRWIT
ncbi:MAG: gephyrin-like molybdotransferase Glp, partial [Candidatus Hydrothermarchaeaceae archaeon]